MATALVLIDIQNDYFPGGKMELVGSLAASECARSLLERARKTGLPLVHIQHVAVRPGSTFFLPDTEGVNTHPNVLPQSQEAVIQKHFPNAFRETRLLDWLRERSITRLVIAGMMTHMCVDATTRAATDHGFDCLIAEDACATRALSFAGHTIPAESVHYAFLAALNGSYGKVMPTRQILEHLAKE